MSEMSTERSLYVRVHRKTQVCPQRIPVQGDGQAHEDGRGEEAGGITVRVDYFDIHGILLLFRVFKCIL